MYHGKLIALLSRISVFNSARKDELDRIPRSVPQILRHVSKHNGHQRVFNTGDLQNLSEGLLKVSIQITEQPYARTHQ